MNRARVRVWDPVVRVLHWTLVAAVALAAISTVVLFGAHQPAGYAVLVVLHVIGAVATGCMHRENLVRAMVDGRKRAPESDARM